MVFKLVNIPINKQDFDKKLDLRTKFKNNNG